MANPKGVKENPKQRKGSQPMRPVKGSPAVGGRPAAPTRGGRASDNDGDEY